MRILVTGGCGYIGSVLVPKLLKAGHIVANVDAQWFGNRLEPHENLFNVKADLRDDLTLDDFEAVIHLANIANDPAGDLDPKLTWEVNALATARLASQAARNSVEQFIYASSGSVYGVSDADHVTEETPLVPLTEYNKTKMVAERVLLSYLDDMSIQIVRPGTVCGASPRQRLDITVNGMVAVACSDLKIRVVGGAQNRPNVHIQDITDVFMWMLERPYARGIWNAGFENLTGFEIASLVRNQIGDLEIKESSSPDRRSYRMDSSKLLSAGFKPQHTVRDAISDLCAAYSAGEFKNEDGCYNLRTMKALSIA